jgi:hypothetical protein
MDDCMVLGVSEFRWEVKLDGRNLENCAVVQDDWDYSQLPITFLRIARLKERVRSEFVLCVQEHVQNYLLFSAATQIGQHLLVLK